mmetsp:Transcript_29835/g.70265  ORF Transcript_29835/g.70265 Transcript_29835/m.70265 type:complete len:272 (+) Transcript_29835:1082-1897(+)
MVTMPLTDAASFSHSGWRSWQYPHPFRHIFTNTRCGLSTTCSFQLEDVSVTTLDENRFWFCAATRMDDRFVVVVVVIERMPSSKRTIARAAAELLPRFPPRPNGRNTNHEDAATNTCTPIAILLLVVVVVVQGPGSRDRIPLGPFLGVSKRRQIPSSTSTKDSAAAVDPAGDGRRSTTRRRSRRRSTRTMTASRRTKPPNRRTPIPSRPSLPLSTWNGRKRQRERWVASCLRGKFLPTRFGGHRALVLCLCHRLRPEEWLPGAGVGFLRPM